MQTLSLCMIVRDEASLLPQFLARTHGLWDELCVVDTGSVDSTGQIVREAGGRLQTFLWNEDFSAARNLSLEMASGDWVLVLDADEMVAPALVSSARKIAARHDIGAAVLPFVGLDAFGSMTRTNHLRMFRRYPGLQYRYRLHEDICDPISKHLTRTGLRIAHLAGHVSHLGDDPARQAQKGIRARDAALWQMTLAQNLYDLQGWYERLAHAQRWESPQQVQQEGLVALAALDQIPLHQVRADPQAWRLLVAIAEILALTDASQAVRVLFNRQNDIAPHVGYFVRRAELLMQAQQPSAAAADFHRCLQLAHTVYDVQLGQIRPLVGLAKIYAAQGDMHDALQYAYEALRFDPRDPLALATLADLSLQQHGTHGLLVAAQSYVNRYGECYERQSTFTQRQVAYEKP